MKIFGTDGVRGVANTFPITPHSIVSIAIAASKHFIGKPRRFSNSGHFTVVIGKDTRLSGYMIEGALISGFVSMGINVVLLGPIPTPGVSMLTKSLRADFGVMISASHNPGNDNGVKFFNSSGQKISLEDENSIDNLIKEEIPLALPSKIGKASRLDDAQGRYIEFVKSTFNQKDLDGIKIVIDCANGSSYKVAPKVLWELGAKVIAIGDNPDGFNINDNVGATSLGALQCKVIETNADIGIALDGDGDRLAVVDEKGQIIDGDQVIALIAEHAKNTGKIKGSGIAVTHYSNLGLDIYLNKLGLKTYKSDVGDRNVFDMMVDKQCNIGGEKSGHIIFREYVDTGDGLISALQILRIIKKSNIKSSKIFSVFHPVPQMFENFKLKQKIIIDDYPKIKNKVDELSRGLEKNKESDSDFHILLRMSGTEPVLRLTMQCRDNHRLKESMKQMSDIINNELHSILLVSD